MIKELQNIGLNKSQAVIYREILKNKQINGGDLIKITKFHRMVVYTALKELEKIKLIVSNKKKGVYYFSPNPAESITKYLNSQKEIAQGIKENIKKIRTLPPPVTNPPNVEVYQGNEGFSIYLEKILKETPKNDQIYFFNTFKNNTYNKFTDLLNNFQKKRENKKIIIKELKNIFLKNSKKIKNNSNSKFKQERSIQLDDKTIIPLTFKIFSKFIAFELDIDEHYVIIVEDKELQKNFKEIFNSIWKKSTKS